MLAISAMNVANSYVGRDFMTSIEQHDTARFAWMALVYVAVFAGSTLLAVYFRFCEERLGLLSRQWLTRALVLDYLGIATPYRLRERARSTIPTSASPTCALHHHASFVPIKNDRSRSSRLGRVVVDHAGLLPRRWGMRRSSLQ
jgi:hypothetical protein